MAGWADRRPMVHAVRDGSRSRAPAEERGHGRGGHGGRRRPRGLGRRDSDRAAAPDLPPVQPVRQRVQRRRPRCRDRPRTARPGPPPGCHHPQRGLREPVHPPARRSCRVPRRVRPNRPSVPQRRPVRQCDLHANRRSHAHRKLATAEPGLRRGPPPHVPERAAVARGRHRPCASRTCRTSRATSRSRCAGWPKSSMDSTDPTEATGSREPSSWAATSTPTRPILGSTPCTPAAVERGRRLLPRGRLRRVRAAGPPSTGPSGRTSSTRTPTAATSSTTSSFRSESGLPGFCGCRACAVVDLRPRRARGRRRLHGRALVSGGTGRRCRREGNPDRLDLPRR